MRAGLPVEAQIGRFTVFRAIEPMRAQLGTRLDSGRYAFDAVLPGPGSIVVARAYHPFWRIVDGPPEARTMEAPAGQLAIAGLPSGKSHIVIAYVPPRTWPLGLAGWAAIAALGLSGKGKRRSMT